MGLQLPAASNNVKTAATGGGGGGGVTGGVVVSFLQDTAANIKKAIVVYLSIGQKYRNIDKDKGLWKLRVRK